MRRENLCTRKCTCVYQEGAPSSELEIYVDWWGSRNGCTNLGMLELRACVIVTLGCLKCNNWIIFKSSSLTSHLLENNIIFHKIENIQANPPDGKLPFALCFFAPPSYISNRTSTWYTNKTRPTVIGSVRFNQQPFFGFSSGIDGFLGRLNTYQIQKGWVWADGWPDVKDFVCSP